MPDGRRIVTKLANQDDVSVSGLASGHLLRGNGPAFVPTTGLSVSSAGALLANAGTVSLPGLSVTDDPSDGIWQYTPGGIAVVTGAPARVLFNSTQVGISSGSKIVWTSGNVYSTSADTGLTRKSAAVIALTDGSTGAGALSVPTPAAGAGLSLVLSGSAAASGNTNGGNVVLTPGLKSGSGADGVAAVQNGNTRQRFRVYESTSNYIEIGGNWQGTGYSSIGNTNSGGNPLVLQGVGGLYFDGGNVVRLTISGAGLFSLWDGANFVLGTSTGTKWGTATGQKQAWWGATPVVQQVLATGAGATVDNVISLLQTLGLCKQA